MEKEQINAKGFSLGDDLSNTLVNESFYLTKNDTIPNIQTMGQRKGNYGTFWYRGYIYYIEVFKETRGFGSRSGFIRSCFMLFDGSNYIELSEFVKSIKSANIIVEELKTNHNIL